ncbi:MAG: patatin-like phospholipase family protein, partial [Candidatus Latescibacterota bacterium]
METGAEKRKIGLVLGGGGARGIAHLGAIKALAELGYEPDAIAGCSMGAVIGSMVAGGMSPDEVIEAFRSLQAHELLDFGAMGGIIGGKKIAKKI